MPAGGSAVQSWVCVRLLSPAAADSGSARSLSVACAAPLTRGWLDGKLWATLQAPLAALILTRKRMSGTKWTTLRHSLRHLVKIRRIGLPSAGCSF
jgi:hypothetical protein